MLVITTKETLPSKPAAISLKASKISGEYHFNCSERAGKEIQSKNSKISQTKLPRRAKLRTEKINKKEEGFEEK